MFTAKKLNLNQTKYGVIGRLQLTAHYHGKGVSSKIVFSVELFFKMHFLLTGMLLLFYRVSGIHGICNGDFFDNCLGSFKEMMLI